MENHRNPLDPIEARKDSDDLVRLMVSAEDEEWCGYDRCGGFVCFKPAGHQDACTPSPPRRAWTWDAAQLRAASKALAALADQLDETRRNAGPGCTFTKADALKLAGADRAHPIAYIGDGCVHVGWAGGELWRGATWWEASARAGLFGTALAYRMRSDEPERSMARDGDWSALATRDTRSLPHTWMICVRRGDVADANSETFHGGTLANEPTADQLHAAIREVRVLVEGATTRFREEPVTPLPEGP